MKANIKKCLGVTWKVGLGLIGVAALVVGILIVKVWHEETYGRCEWEEESLSSKVVVEGFNDERVRVRNKETGRYTTPKLKWVSGIPERDSLTVFCDMAGRRGFLNINDGEVVIPAQYDRAWQFSEGLGAVVGKNGKVGFIDRDNRLVIGCEIPYEPGFDYVFKDGSCTVVRWDKDSEDYVFAVYGKDGRLILPWGLKRVTDLNEDGYRIIGDEEGEWLYDREFRRVSAESSERLSFAAGMDGAGGVYRTRNNIKQLVDYSGNVIEPFVIDRTRPLKYMVKYNDEDADDYELVSDIAVYVVNSWEGLLDLRTGKPLTPPNYWSVDMASKDLVSARLGYGNESVLLDKRGRVVNR
jgi:hypothetical protein